MELQVFKKKKNLFRHHVPKLPYFIQHSDLVTSSVKLKGEFKKKIMQPASSYLYHSFKSLDANCCVFSTAC